jgi:capsular exopolysaccharide synthesis family protein
MSRFFEAVQRAEQSAGARHPPAPEKKQSIRDETATPPGRDDHRPAAPPAHYRTVSIRVPASAPLMPFDGTHLHAAERYRSIRTRIVQHPRQPRTLCISSTSTGDGKTVSALNIAASLALKKQTTALLMDGDLRRPQLAKLLGIPDSPGLADYLAGGCTLQEAIMQIEELPSLYFLPAGHGTTNPTELLDSDRWRQIMESLHQDFNFCVVDTPPIGLVADYDLIQTVCDGVILIVRPGHSNRSLLQKGLAQMPKDKFLGVVINHVAEWFLWQVQDRYYYGYSGDRDS